MQVVSFMNMKGGVGKTTLAVNVAYGLAYFHGKKVLVVDADPQFNATQCLVNEDDYLRHLDDETKGTLRDIFSPKRHTRISSVRGQGRQSSRVEKSLTDCTIKVAANTPTGGKLDVLPSELSLVDLDFAKRGTENRLDSFLQQKAKHYDFVIIDCPPTISLFTHAALMASSKYIVPIKPEPLSVLGLPLLETWIEDFIEDRGRSLERVGLIFTMVRGPVTNKTRSVMDQMRSERPGDVFATGMSQADAVSSAVESHKPVFLHKPSSKSSRQVTRIVEEFLGRAGG